MKKHILSAVILAVLIVLTSCSSDPNHGTSVSQSKTVDQVLKENAQMQTSAPQDPGTTEKAPVSDAETVDLDIDLTKLNSTVVYSEVYQMLSEPDQFMGKTIRMHGTAGIYAGEARNYYTCIVKDATACCANGIEFMLQDGYKYPQEGEEITVVGEYETYVEDGLTYCQLKNAIISK